MTEFGLSEDIALAIIVQSFQYYEIVKRSLSWTALDPSAMVIKKTTEFRGLGLVGYVVESLRLVKINLNEVKIHKIIEVALFSSKS